MYLVVPAPSLCGETLPANLKLPEATTKKSTRLQITMLSNNDHKAKNSLVMIPRLCETVTAVIEAI
jgi:hypothetical protein